MNIHLTCQTVARRISDSQDLMLPPAERVRVGLHLLVCAKCRHVKRQVGFLRRAMLRLDDQHSSSALNDPWEP